MPRLFMGGGSMAILRDLYSGIACALVLLLTVGVVDVRAQNESPVYSIELEIPVGGLAAVRFTSCTRLESRSEVLETYTSGSLYPDKEPGLVRTTELTCTKPLDATTYVAFSDWRRSVEQGAVERVNASYIFRDLNQGGQEVFRFNIFEAWPSSYGIECSVGNVCVEKITIVFEWMELA